MGLDREISAPPPNTQRCFPRERLEMSPAVLSLTKTQGRTGWSQEVWVWGWRWDVCIKNKIMCNQKPDLC